MALIKHNARTNRKPCYCHGSASVYWAHDSQQPVNRDGSTCETCTTCGGRGRMVLIDADDSTRGVDVGGIVPESARHNKKAVAEEATTESDETSVTESKSPFGTPAPPPVSAAPPQDAVAAALATLAGAFGPQVDREQIRAMVRDEFAATVFPTRTVIVGSDGNDKTPADMPESSHEQFADVLTILHAAQSSPVPMSVLMVGPAGSGKSTIAKDAATALHMPYGEISLNPMLPVTSLLGYMNATGQYVRTVFRDIWETGGVFHADEFDNAHPSTMATLNAALACGKGGSIAFPDGMVPRADEFTFIASANTFGRGPDRVYVGRQQLDAATLNRFVTVEITYDEALEHSMCLATGLDNDKVAEVLRYVRGIRSNISNTKMTVLMTPRNAVFACSLLRAGVRKETVIRSTLRNGVSDSDWHKATADVVAPRL